MLEHFSGSGMNQFDNDIHTYYTRYVLGEEPNYCDNIRNAMEFGKNYEILLGENEYKWWDTQKECEFIIDGYKAYWLFDFYNKYNKDIVEVKTRTKRWTEDEIHNSWQFRIYNYRANNNGFRFMIHQYNKKKWEAECKTINWEDKTFEQDFVSKCEQIERFLNQFNIEVKKYSLDRDNQNVI